MVAPTRNLPPEAEPWGRYVEDSLRAMAGDNSRSQEAINNSLLAINGTLTQMAQQITDIAQATADAAAAAADAAAIAAGLAARVTVSTSVPTFNTGILPGDGLDHFYGTDMSITVNVPTGRLLLTIGCGQATVDAGTVVGKYVLAEATYQIPGVVNFYDAGPRLYNADTAHLTGSSMVMSKAYTVPPGIHTITGRMSVFSTATGGSVNFSQPYMTVQVTG